MYINIIIGRIPITILIPIFFSRGSRACRHASPRCVDQHFVVQRLIGILHPSSPRAPQGPSTSEVAQWHTQFTRVAFGTPPGNKPKNTSQISPWLGADTITKSPHQSTNPQPSMWRESPKVIRNPQLQSQPSATNMNHKCMNTRVSPTHLTKENQPWEWRGEEGDPLGALKSVSRACSLTWMEHKCLGVREEKGTAFLFLELFKRARMGNGLSRKKGRSETRPYPLPATHPTVAVAQSCKQFQCG